MTLNFLNEVDIECSYDRRNYKKNNNFLFLNELLFDAREAQELYRTQFRNIYEIRKLTTLLNILFKTIAITFLFLNRNNVKTRVRTLITIAIFILIATT
jgi:hypothetical protein